MAMHSPSAEGRDQRRRSPRFATQHGVTPTLAVVCIGDDEAAAGYARAIEKNCKSVGVALPSPPVGRCTTQDEAADFVRRLSADRLVHGVMILEPIAQGLQLDALVDLIDPSRMWMEYTRSMPGGFWRIALPLWRLPPLPAGCVCWRRHKWPSKVRTLWSWDVLRLSASRWRCCSCTAIAP